MFTGIIRGLGRVESVEEQSGGEGCEFRIEFPGGSVDWEQVAQPGASVAVDGVCLTSTRVDSTGFRVDVSQESLDKTTLSDVEPGRPVNLEPSLRVGDEIGGHFVFGHVDTTVPIRTLERRGIFTNCRSRFRRVCGASWQPRVRWPWTVSASRSTRWRAYY